MLSYGLIEFLFKQTKNSNDTLDLNPQYILIGQGDATGSKSKLYLSRTFDVRFAGERSN